MKLKIDGNQTNVEITENDKTLVYKRKLLIFLRKYYRSSGLYKNYDLILSDMRFTYNYRDTTNKALMIPMEQKRDIATSKPKSEIVEFKYGNKSINITVSHQVMDNIHLLVLSIPETKSQRYSKIMDYSQKAITNI